MAYVRSAVNVYEDSVLSKRCSMICVHRHHSEGHEAQHRRRPIELGAHQFQILAGIAYSAASSMEIMHQSESARVRLIGRAFCSVAKGTTVQYIGSRPTY